MARNVCIIDGCDAPARVRGWCTKHYKRWRKHGDPTVFGRDVRRFPPIKLARPPTVLETPCREWWGQENEGRHE